MSLDIMCFVRNNLAKIINIDSLLSARFARDEKAAKSDAWLQPLVLNFFLRKNFAENKFFCEKLIFDSCGGMFRAGWSLYMVENYSAGNLSFLINRPIFEIGRFKKGRKGFTWLIKNGHQG